MGQRSWLTELINTSYLPEIARLQDTPQGRSKVDQLARSLRRDWEERGFTTLARQQGLMDQTRRILKDYLGEEHFCLDLIRFTTAEYTQINQLKQERVQERNEAVQFLDNPDAIVSQAVHMLESPEWAMVAAGLSLLTGRRSSELLSTARFELVSKWSIKFTGALKRRQEIQTLQFEIPTLTTAERVCIALAKIRQALPESAQLSTAMVNSRYGQAVIRACNQGFAELIPRREGRDSLYTHLFRSIYATIATFWYCPPRVNATEFKAAIQGHYGILEAENSELRRSLAASRHYSDFEISDRVIALYNGQRQGVKLGFGGVVPISIFQQAWEAGNLAETGEAEDDIAPGGERKQATTLRVWQQDKPRLLSLLSRIGVTEGRQQDRLAELLGWVEKQLEQKPVLPTESLVLPPQQQPEKVTPISRLLPLSRRNYPWPQPRLICRQSRRNRSCRWQRSPLLRPHPLIRM
jgi:Telomere resolvase